MAMRNAQASCYTGALESDKDIFASAKSPTTLRLTGGSTSIRQLLSQGVGIDTELLVDAAEAEAEDHVTGSVDIRHPHLHVVLGSGILSIDAASTVGIDASIENG